MHAPVLLYVLRCRKILEALKLMRLDLVNFTIAHFRPYVQQHSIDYEKHKFKSLLDIQKGNIIS